MKMLIPMITVIIQLLLNNVNCQEQTCKITKTYSCDDYGRSNYDVIVGKMGPRGPPGRDCNLTSVQEHLRKVQHKLNKSEQGLSFCSLDKIPNENFFLRINISP